MASPNNLAGRKVKSVYLHVIGVERTNRNILRVVCKKDDRGSVTSVA
jgi:hypothetical protein